MIGKLFADLLCPDNLQCIICGEEIFTNDDFCICENCNLKLRFLTNVCQICGTKILGAGTLCERCKNNDIKNIKLARSVFEYKGNIRSLVYNLKYDNKKYLAKPLSNLLYNYYINSKDFDNIDIIIPVPIHKNRLKQRGYNQAELLLNSFAKTNKLKFDLVERIVDTPTQTEKTHKERLENLKGAFKLTNPNEIKGKNILIVDDVFTTGATCSTIAELLIKAKAKSVKCLTLCNTTKENLH